MVGTARNWNRRVYIAAMKSADELIYSFPASPKRAPSSSAAIQMMVWRVCDVSLIAVIDKSFFKTAKDYLWLFAAKGNHY